MNRSDADTIVLKERAAAMVAEGLGSSVVLRELRRMNAEERNPVSEEVLRGIVEAASGSRADSSEVGKGAGRAVVVTLADVEPKVVEYIWDPAIARRNLTLVEGDGGIGKSTALSAIASALTRGRMPGPDGKPSVRGKPETVLMLVAEDGIAEVVRPRCEGMGADLTRIKILTGILTDGVEFPLMLDEEGLGRLDQVIEEEKPAAVIIDPIVQHLGSKVDMFRPNEVRSVLAPLMSMAQRHDCAIVVVRHLNKGSGSATYRGQGSQDFYNASRSVLLVGRDPQDPKRSVIVHAKCNYAATGPSHAFSVENGVFGWCGEVEMTADELLAVSDGSTHQEVLDLYDPAKGTPITAALLESELGMNPATARQRLHRMWKKSRQLDKVGYGEYVPVGKSDHRNTVTLSQSSHTPESVTSVTTVTRLQGLDSVTVECPECGSTDGRCRFDKEAHEWVCFEW